MNFHIKNLLSVITYACLLLKSHNLLLSQFSKVILSPIVYLRRCRRSQVIQCVQTLENQSMFVKNDDMFPTQSTWTHQR